MPINPDFEFLKAKDKYEAAQTPIEKLAALEEMRSTAPSHKGAEKLRAEISRKIASLKSKIERQKTQAKKGAAPSINIKKEGAGQVAVVGAPNSGKSTLLKALTDAEVEVAPYPFTTKRPVAGMMGYGGALVQLVEIPAIIEGSSRGRADGIQLLSIIRNADAIVLTVREDPAGEEQLVKKELEKAGIILNREKPKISIRPSEFKGVTISGKPHLKIKEEEIENFLKSCGMPNANVVIGEEVKNLDKFVEVLDNRLVYRKALILDMRKELPKNIRKRIFSMLGRIRIFTKKPGEEVRKDAPLILKEGETAAVAVEKLHKEFAQRLKYVKVWGSSKFPGQRVSRGYVLKDGDIIEVYA